jgi:hypothetical protein
MGGNDDYEWTFDSDETLKKYGTGIPHIIAEETPVTPPISEDRSRSNSIISATSGDEDDIYFDANDSLTSIPLTPPITEEQQNLIIPHPITIMKSPNLTSPTSLPGTSNYNTNSYYGNLSSWAGLRMGVEFLTSFIDTKKGDYHQHRAEKQIASFAASTLNNTNTNEIDELLLPSISSQSDNIVIVNPTTNTTAEITNTTSTEMIHPPFDNTNISIAGYNLKLIETYLKRLTHRILELSMGQRGMVYWVLLYMFLRGPVESLVKRSLVRTSIVGPQRITTTTIGITAAVAAVVGTSISSSIERKRLK